MAKPAAPKGTAKLTWGDATQLSHVPADDLHVQDMGDRVLLTFGQLRMPIFVGPPPAGLEVEIRPVVKFVITKETMRKMVAALNSVVPPAGETGK